MHSTLVNHNTLYLSHSRSSEFIPEGCDAAINPLQQELNRRHVWQFLLATSSRLPAAAARRRRQQQQQEERGRLSGCASSGRSGRGDGHSEGSSGDPLRRLAPSCSPEREEAKMRESDCWLIQTGRRLTHLLVGQQFVWFFVLLRQKHRTETTGQFVSAV